MRTTSLFLSAVTPFFAVFGLTASAASISAEQTLIKTYSFSEPDPLPALVGSGMWGSASRIYPYYFFDKYSPVGADKPWNVVRMENPYIEVSVLPDVGGKIYGAIEKSTGKEFIYLNSVLKFRDIALRGPWTSGGVEFNFGIVGHTANTATPVDYLIRENKDGSVSCVVGTMDVASRTRWSVTITLPQDKALFETHPFYYNPSPFHQSYYVWMNSAVETGDDLQYTYPGKGYLDGQSLKTWPTDAQGRDLSFYKNNNFNHSVDYFVCGKYADFYGTYWHNSQFGSGHWALYDDMPGRKIFIWAISQQGGIWEKLLTDSDGQYTEPQAGRLLSQGDHAFFSPYTADHWTESWFPYKAIGPMVKASPYGVLHVTRDADDSLELGLCSLQHLDDDIIVTSAGKELHRERLQLKPMEVYRKKLPFSVAEGELRIDVGDKLNYSDEPAANDLLRPFGYKDTPLTTAEGRYLAGLKQEKQRYYSDALQQYSACVKLEPAHGRALTRLAELYCRRGEYEQALGHAHKVLEADMYDPAANYIYGVVCRRLGKLVDAKAALGWAARSMEYRSAAYCQMAEICYREGQLRLALEYGQRSLDFNKYNMNAYQVLAITYRTQDLAEKAREILEQLLAIEPLNHLARFEIYLSDPTSDKLSAFQSMIRNEMPFETYLEMSLYYAQLGLESEAVRLLEYSPAHPTVSYWLAYFLRDRDVQRSGQHLAKAAKMSPEQVFPFREESIPVFQWALQEAPGDWKAKYYLGLIYWHKGRLDDAYAMFEQCGKPDYAPFYVTRGYLCADTDSAKALADFEAAVTTDDSDWRNWHHLVKFYRDHAIVDNALKYGNKAYQRFPDETVIRTDYARILLDNNKYADALAILENTAILPNEGAREYHDMYVRCNIRLAIGSMEKGDYTRAHDYLEASKAYPEHLGTGRPLSPDFSLPERLQAICRDNVNSMHKFEMTDEIAKLLKERGI